MGNEANKPFFVIKFKDYIKAQKASVLNHPSTPGIRPVKRKKQQNKEIIKNLDFFINAPALDLSGNLNNQLEVNKDSLYQTSLGNLNVNSDMMNTNGNKFDFDLQKDRKIKGKVLKDQRKRAPIGKYPYCCIGFLTSYFQNGKTRGTACLISPNHLLTCAHNIYNRKTKKMATHIDFLLSLQQQNENGSIFHGNVMKVPEQYKLIPEDSKSWHYYDFAIIKLSGFDDLQLDYGYLGVNTLWRTSERKDTITISGYPSESKETGFGICRAQMESKGQCLDVKEKAGFFMITYEIYTSSGQSGSPIFIESKEKNNQIIGIHTMGSPTLNRGVLLSEASRHIMNSWIEQMKTIFDISDRNIGNEGLSSFMSTFKDFIPKIVELHLANNRIGSNGVAILTEVEWESLKILNLENNNIKKEGARFLAVHTRLWKQLEVLNLNYTNIQDQGLIQLLGRQDLNQKLKELYLNRCQLGRSAILSFAKYKWHLLEVLHLANNKITSNDMNILFSPIQGRNSETRSVKRFQVLRDLNLGSNGIGNGAARILADHYNQLQNLNLNGIDMDIEGMRMLGSQVWPKLRKLKIDWNKKISYLGVATLTPESFPSLAYLSMDSILLGVRGLETLMFHRWSYLKHLSVSHNYLRNQGMGIFDDSKLISLEVLNVEGNNITKQGVAIFLQNGNWYNMMKMNLRSNGVDREGFCNLVKNLRNLNTIDANNNSLAANQKRDLKMFAENENKNLHLDLGWGEEVREV